MNYVSINYISENFLSLYILILIFVVFLFSLGSAVEFLVSLLVLFVDLARLCLL